MPLLLTPAAMLDKIIEVDLITADGQVEQILCPDTGIKPDIKLAAEWTTNAVAKDIELRITNFYPGRPLTDYAYINIRAGYRGGLMATVSGPVWNAYQESPGPDGVTRFAVFLGDFVTWQNKAFSKRYAVGARVQSILDDIAALCGVVSDQPDLTMLDDTGQRGGVLTAPLTFSCLVKEAVKQLCATFRGLTVFLGSSRLVAFRNSGSTGRIVRLDYFSSPPKADAAGWTCVAPWHPELMPGDQVQMQPEYYAQNFTQFASTVFRPNAAAASVTGKKIFTVYQMSVDFETNGPNNRMSLLMIATEGA